MLRSSLTLISEKLEIDDVRDVQITTIVDDGENGFVRSVRFFGEPSSDNGSSVVLEVLIRSESKSDLKITTPEIDF